MLQPFSERLKEVARYYQSGDTHLGLRRMIDAALETQQTEIYSRVLSFCEHSENNKSAAEQSPYALLELIEKAGRAEAVSAHEMIEIAGVAKRYKSGNFQLSPVSLKLSGGEIAGLVGENGNGKTTLLRVMAGELRPDEGAVVYNFRQPAIDNYECRTKIAFVQQRIPRWWGSLYENLSFTAAMYGYKGKENELLVEMMIARLGLRPYKTLSWARLSSGYRTRFELARTLLRRPEVLLLDEPLSNLDIISQQTILQDLRFLAQSEVNPMAIVLSSQQIYEVEKVSDVIVFLKQGAPVYQQLKNTTAVTEQEQTVFELETPATSEQLQQAFAELQLQHIKFNGGVYVITFNGNVNVHSFLSTLASHQFEVNYFRNISRSARRFFANV